DPATGAAASYRFSSGWWSAPGTASTPDKLQVVADKEIYKAGDTAKISIKPPFAGPVLIAVATDRIIETRTIDATPDGTIVEIPVSGDWGAGAYVLATAYRPSPAEATHAPGRAIGVACMGTAPPPPTLPLSPPLPSQPL